MDPTTGQLVDGGADIPLEQILAGPMRSKLAFEQGPSGERSLGQMISGQGNDGLPAEVVASGWNKKQTQSWNDLTKGQCVAYRTGTSRELSVGFILYNNRAEKSVSIQVCRSIWTGAALRHRKEWRRSDVNGSYVELEPYSSPLTSQLKQSCHIER